MLKLIKKLLRRNKPPRQYSNNIDYWHDRVRQFGRRSVLNLAHSAAELDEVTDRQCAEVFPHFQAALTGRERGLLDFGCGCGRFSSRLAAVAKCHVYAADPIPSLLGLSPENPNVSYLRIEAGRIPLADASVDAVWIALVLGGIRDSDMPQVAREIVRVSSDSACMCLVENTAHKPNAPHWYFRNVAWYQSLFPQFNLAEVHSYVDVGERISVLLGRRSCPTTTEP